MDRAIGDVIGARNKQRLIDGWLDGSREGIERGETRLERQRLTNQLNVIAWIGTGTPRITRKTKSSRTGTRRGSSSREEEVFKVDAREAREGLCSREPESREPSRAEPRGNEMDLEL